MKKMHNVFEEQIQEDGLQIVPQLRWVAEFGGPEITALLDATDGEIEIQNLKFKWRIWDRPRAEKSGISCHFRDQLGAHTGWLTLYFDDEKVSWDVTKIVADIGTENEPYKTLTVDTAGTADNINLAVVAAKNWDFQPAEKSGVIWFKTSENGWKGFDGEDALTIKSFGEDNEKWRWKRESKKLESLLEFSSTQALAGRSETREQAMAEAAGAVENFLAAARELTKTTDEFEAGKAAGRAELLAEIQQLAK